MYLFLLDITFVRIYDVCSHGLFIFYACRIYIHGLNILQCLFCVQLWWKFRLCPWEVLKILLLWIFWNTSFKIQIYLLLLSVNLEMDLDHKECISLISVDITKQFSKLIVLIYVLSGSSSTALAYTWYHQVLVFFVVNGHING